MLINCNFILGFVPFIFLVSHANAAEIFSHPSCRALPSSSFMRDCGSEEDIAQIFDVKITPELKIGQESNIFIIGHASKEITDDAEVKITLSLGSIPLFSLKVNLCDKISDYGISCPIKKGNFTLKAKVTVPSEALPGTFDIEAEAKTSSEARIADFKMHLQL